MEWKVLQLRPRTEKKVAEICQRNQLPCYLPLRQSVRIYPRRKAIFERPLFPNYIFAAYDETRRTMLFRGNYIIRVLKPESQIGLLRQLVQVRRLLRADPGLEAVDRLACGELVRIKTGPFAGFEGIVSRLKHKPGMLRVVLNIELVGRAVAAETDARFVERISTGTSTPIPPNRRTKK